MFVRVYWKTGEGIGVFQIASRLPILYGHVRFFYSKVIDMRALDTGRLAVLIVDHGPREIQFPIGSPPIRRKYLTVLILIAPRQRHPHKYIIGHSQVRSNSSRET